MLQLPYDHHSDLPNMYTLSAGGGGVTVAFVDEGEDAADGSISVIDAGAAVGRGSKAA